MADRHQVHNFNAGPAALPQAVLNQAQGELLNFKSSGMSVMELSHRSKLYEGVQLEAEATLKRLLGITDDYDVLFLQGGASLQFAMLPMNFLKQGTVAGYVRTGAWADKAMAEARSLGETKVVASTEANRFKSVPDPSSFDLTGVNAYVHLTSNETIGGVQWQSFPDTGSVPLVADMSSDILSRPVDVNQFAMIYAGAQKNLGPSGVTVVIVRKDWVAQANTNLPTMLKYATFAKNHSLYNTPPTFAIYLLGLVLKWAEEQGGVSGLAQMNEAKAQTIYQAIDGSGGFYQGFADGSSRSRMNITFTLSTPELEKQFLAEAGQVGFVGLAGHRSVGGCRASLYNAVSQASCDALAQFMGEFARRNG